MLVESLAVTCDPQDWTQVVKAGHYSRIQNLSNVYTPISSRVVGTLAPVQVWGSLELLV